jgi:hypothetical protein
MNLCFLGYAALAFYFQTDVFLAAAGQRLSVGAFLAAESYLLIANLALATLYRRRPDAHGALLQLALWSAIAGPFGTLIAAGLGMFRWPPATSEFAEWLQGQVEPQRKRRLQRIRSELRYNRSRIEGASAVTPLGEIFLEGSQKERLDALNAISRRFEPALAPALRLASKDADASVRVLAATVTAMLQKTQIEGVGVKMAAARSERTPQAWLALAEARLRYEASGLIGAAHRKIELREALAAMEEALRLAFANWDAPAELVAAIAELGRALDADKEIDVSAHIYALATEIRRTLAQERDDRPLIRDLGIT